MTWIRSTLLVAVAVGASGACTAKPKADGPAAVRVYPVADFYEGSSYLGGSFNADKSRILVSSDLSGVYNAYAVPTDGGDPQPLTTSTTDAIFAVGYFPNDGRILYRSDRGGNELTHLYVREVDGRVTDLTPGDKLKATFIAWAFDHNTFFVATNERDPRFFDLYEFGINQYKRRLVYRNTAGYDYGPISRDKRYLSLIKARTTSDNDLYLYEIPTRATKLITKHEGSVSSAPQDFTPDSRSLLYTSDEGSEFASLRAYSIEDDHSTVLLNPKWDVISATFSPRGKHLTAVIDEDSHRTARIYDAATMEERPLADAPPGVIASFEYSRDEGMYMLYAGDGSAPNELYAGIVGFRPRRLTNSLTGNVKREDLVAPVVARFKSYDSLEVPGVLYKPRQASASNRVPAVVLVHGGPGGQALAEYRPLVQALANHGYAVFDINNRGSSGYGKSFFRMDDRKHGEADLGDVVAAMGFLHSTGYVDSTRIAVVGGSYGGYMVLAALTLRPDAFKAGVDMFGISNWVRTLQSVPPWWESVRQALYEEMGDPATDAARLRRISPLFNATRIKAPLMVLQGANDPRVLKVESDEIVDAVKKRGVPVEYIVFPDEGHGFVKKENEIKGYTAVIDFLDRYVKGSTPKGTE
jgi:dipeptidyl aminopeptidase/acylaminoacyl peptidase